jgi:hypothetical protein
VKTFIPLQDVQDSPEKIVARILAVAADDDGQEDDQGDDDR